MIEKLTSLEDGQKELTKTVGKQETRMERTENPLDAVFEETAGLAEFRTEVKTTVNEHGKLLDILSRRSLIQETEIRDLRMAK